MVTHETRECNFWVASLRERKCRRLICARARGKDLAAKESARHSFTELCVSASSAFAPEYPARMRIAGAWRPRKACASRRAPCRAAAATPGMPAAATPHPPTQTPATAIPTARWRPGCCWCAAALVLCLARRCQIWQHSIAEYHCRRWVRASTAQVGFRRVGSSPVCL